MKDIDQFLKGMDTYINGKMKRYNLLFAVNGGAFGLAKLMSEDDHQILGGLNLSHISFGAILFSLIMTFDIWIFAKNFKKALVAVDPAFQGQMFGIYGKIILLLLCALLVSAWLLAAF